MAIGSPFVCLYNHARGRGLHVAGPRPSKRELLPLPAVAGTRGAGMPISATVVTVSGRVRVRVQRRQSQIGQWAEILWAGQFQPILRVSSNPTQESGGRRT